MARTGAPEAAVGQRIEQRVTGEDEGGRDTCANGRPSNEQRHDADRGAKYCRKNQ